MGLRLTSARRVRNWTRRGLLALALLSMLPALPAVAACDAGRVELRGDWGTARFRVEIADTPEARARGLMFVENLAPSAGMLFVFPDERVRSFWMRNTLVSLDILYFDEAGRWVSAQENAVPLDETGLPSDGPARYVLEINAGLVERFGMGPGTELRHPALEQEAAAWPCAAE